MVGILSTISVRYDAFSYRVYASDYDAAPRRRSARQRRGAASHGQARRLQADVGAELARDARELPVLEERVRGCPAGTTTTTGNNASVRRSRALPTGSDTADRMSTDDGAQHRSTCV